MKAFKHFFLIIITFGVFAARAESTKAIRLVLERGGSGGGWVMWGSHTLVYKPEVGTCTVVNKFVTVNDNEESETQVSSTDDYAIACERLKQAARIQRLLGSDCQKNEDARPDPRTSPDESATETYIDHQCFCAKDDRHGTNILPLSNCRSLFSFQQRQIIESYLH